MKYSCVILSILIFILEAQANRFSNCSVDIPLYCPVYSPSQNVDYLSFSHYFAQLRDFRMHYVLERPQNQMRGVIVLIHGWPETWFEWRHSIRPLSQAGYLVIAPDTRGIGESGKPPSPYEDVGIPGFIGYPKGYDKLTAAEDIHELVVDHLGITAPVIVVGHDIGLMIAYAYAIKYRSEVAAAVLLGAYVPVEGYASFPVIPRPTSPPSFSWWFSALHMVPSMPEKLIRGKESIYFGYLFYDLLLLNKQAVTADDFKEYLRALSAEGALTAGFNYYRNLWRDVDQFKQNLDTFGPLTMPILAIEDEFTQGSVFAQLTGQSGGDVLATNVRTFGIDNVGHFSAEENPEAFNQAVIGFLGTL